MQLPSFAKVMEDRMKNHNLLAKGSLAFFLLIMLSVMMLTGCDRLNNNPAGTPLKVTIGVGSGLLLTPIWIAENQGYFQEEGLDLTIKEFATGKASFQAMSEGTVDISTLAPTPIMFASMTRQDFSVFATFASSDENVKVIGRKDSGINTAKDLKGKRIGTPAGTSAQFFLSSFLVYNNIAESEITEVDIRPPDLLNALDNSQVDAIVIWQPYAYKAQQLLAANAATFTDSKIFKESFNFVAMNEFAKNKAAVLRKILRAVNKASIFIAKHKEKSQEIVVSRTKFDREQLKIFWPDFSFNISLDQELLITLEDQARWAIKKGGAERRDIPNYLDYIKMQALDEVKPAAVTIIR